MGTTHTSLHIMQKPAIITHTHSSVKLVPVQNLETPDFCPVVIDLPISDFALCKLHDWLRDLDKRFYTRCPLLGILCHLCKDDDGRLVWGRTNVDTNGEPLFSVPAGKLTLFFSSYDDDDFTHPSNRAAAHYFSHLPAITPVYLFLT